MGILLNHQTVINGPVIAYGLLCIASIGALIWSRVKKKVIPSFSYNMLSAVLFLAALGFFFCIFYEAGFIHPPMGLEVHKLGFPHSEADALLLVISGIAVVGAWWAILARMDAERAFNKSIEVLNAIGGTFDFPQILSRDRFPAIVQRLENDALKNASIALYLGFPAVGYLSKRSTEFDPSPEVMFETLNHSLFRLRDNIEQGKLRKVQIRISVFSRTDCDNLLNAFQPLVGNSVKRKIIDDLLTTFFERLGELKALQYPTSSGVVVEVEEDMHVNERIRFVHFRSEDGDEEAERALIWVVPNLQHNSSQAGQPPKVVTEAFDSFVLATKSGNFMKLLEKVWR
jgi:hypothetical protein